jgi:hypothetical protein
VSSNESFLKLTSHWSKVLREMDPAQTLAPNAPVPSAAPVPTQCAECGARDQNPHEPCAYCHGVVA